jgi:hypothetical protein
MVDRNAQPIVKRGSRNKLSRYSDGLEAARPGFESRLALGPTLSNAYRRVFPFSKATSE